VVCSNPRSPNVATVEIFGSKRKYDSEIIKKGHDYVVFDPTINVEANFTIVKGSHGTNEKKTPGM